MVAYDNTNHGVLFNKQDRKEKDTWPDYGGELDVEGKMFWISGWLRTSKNGVKFLSISVKAKEAPKAKTVVAQRTEGNNGHAAYEPDPDDGLAF